MSAISYLPEALLQLSLDLLQAFVVLYLQFGQFFAKLLLASLDNEIDFLGNLPADLFFGLIL
jgi:hypothetical protein